MKATLAVAPAVEPLSLDEARQHLRLDDHADDDYLASLIVVAREWIEERTWRALISQTWDFYFDRFGDPLMLGRPPVASSGLSVKYLDDNGVLQTLATSVYELGQRNGIGIVRRKYGQVWPSARDVEDAVVVRAVCGYGANPSDVPAKYRHAMRLLVHHWYEQRMPVVTGTIATQIPLLVESLVGGDAARRF